MPDVPTPLPVNFSRLAREIAMEILPVDDILELHKLDDEQWKAIQANPQFQNTLTDMVREWNASGNTPARVRTKAATGIEAVLEVILTDVCDRTIPLNQRIEAMKLLAKLGELDGARDPIGGAGIAGGTGVTINIWTGNPDSSMVIDAKPAIPAISRDADDV
jgi:hypothetical protein